MVLRFGFDARLASKELLKNDQLSVGRREGVIDSMEFVASFLAASRCSDLRFGIREWPLRGPNILKRGMSTGYNV